MTPEALNALVAAAQSRLRKFINRAAAQHLRRLSDRWGSVDQALFATDGHAKENSKKRL